MFSVATRFQISYKDYNHVLPAHWQFTSFLLSLFFFFASVSGTLLLGSLGGSSSWSLRYLSKVLENPIAANMHTTGVKVNINRTMTPAKYTADTAYNITWRKNQDQVNTDAIHRLKLHYTSLINSKKQSNQDLF